MDFLLQSGSRNYVEPIVFRTRQMSVLSKMLFKDSLAALASIAHDEASFANIKEFYTTEKSKLEESLTASEERLADAEHSIQELEHNRDTQDELVTTVEEAEANLKTSVEHVGFSKDKMSEQSYQMLETDALSTGYPECIVVLRQKLTNTSADAERFITKHRADKYLLNCDRTAPAVQNTASQQCASAHSRDCEKLLADKDITEVELHKYWVDMNAKTVRIQASHDGEVARANAVDI